MRCRNSITSTDRKGRVGAMAGVRILDDSMGSVVYVWCASIWYDRPE